MESLNPVTQEWFCLTRQQSSLLGLISNTVLVKFGNCPENVSLTFNSNIMTLTYYDTEDEVESYVDSIGGTGYYRTKAEEGDYIQFCGPSEKYEPIEPDEEEL